MQSYFSSKKFEKDNSDNKLISILWSHETKENFNHQESKFYVTLSNFY